MHLVVTNIGNVVKLASQAISLIEVKPMSMRCKLDWSSAIHDLRIRPIATASFIADRADRAIQANAAVRATEALPLVLDGRFSRTAVMTQTLAAARLERARGSSLLWKPCSRRL
jgi:hypothetical protein